MIVFRLPHVIITPLHIPVQAQGREAVIITICHMAESWQNALSAGVYSAPQSYVCGFQKQLGSKALHIAFDLEI